MSINSNNYGSINTNPPSYNEAINNGKPKTAEEILKDHYKNNASICNTIVCGDCENPSCFLSKVNNTCNDCCCCLPDNHYVTPIYIGSSGSDCGDCGKGGGEVVAVICCVAAACLAACALYSCGKACNQQRILSNYENLSAPTHQIMK